MDSSVHSGLAHAPTNVFKLADIKGVMWTCYTHTTSSTHERPRDHPVLLSYSKLLNAGYICSWRSSLPMAEEPQIGTDQTATGNADGKELWLFHSESLPNIEGLLSPSLTQYISGGLKDGIAKDATPTNMFFKAIRNLIERSLLSRNFYSLGSWFVKMEPDSRDRASLLFQFDFFIHANEIVCATMNIKAISSLLPLSSKLLTRAMNSQSGVKVLLSPSGVTATLTGHRYDMSDDHVKELIDEWQIFYPGLSNYDSKHSLPAAVEVVVGGTRMKYPSRAIVVLESLLNSDNMDTPAPSTAKPKESRISEPDGPAFLTKQCVCKSIQRTVQQSLKPEKISLSNVRLQTSINKRAAKEEDWEEVGPPHKVARSERVAPTPVAATPFASPSIPFSGVNRANSGIPKYATPLPSPCPCISIPSSPAPLPLMQQLLGAPVSSLGGDSSVEDYDAAVAGMQLATDAMTWKRDSDGWWYCLRLPNDQVTPQMTNVLTSENALIQNNAMLTTISEGTSVPNSVTNSDTSKGSPSSAVMSPPTAKPIYMHDDLIKVPAVLDNIFDEEEDPDKEADPLPGSRDEAGATIDPTGTGRDSLLDLARMFPTPPSVEQACVMDDRAEEVVSECVEGDIPTENGGIFEEEQMYIPNSFAPLSQLPSKRKKVQKLPSSCVYAPRKADFSPGISNSRLMSGGNEVSISSSQSSRAPKFQFPPSPTLISSLDEKRVAVKKRPESLFINHPSLPSTPLFTPMLSPVVRPGRKSSFYHHFASRSGTPRDSPVIGNSDVVTPTPVASHKLQPMLPENYALVFTLTLIDSLTFGKQEIYSYYDCKSESLREDLVKMNYLGFEEDEPNIFNTLDQSKLHPDNGGSTKTGFVSIQQKDKDALSKTQNTMLQIAQNLTIQMTFCDFNFFSNGHDTMKCEAANLLYPENVYISALCKGQVIFSQLWCGQPNYCKQMGKAPQDGNSEKWLLQAQDVKNALAVHSMKGIKGNLLSGLSSVCTPKLHFDGPLCLKEFQLLKPSQALFGSDCVPVPIPPVAVSYEQDHVSISPLALCSWEHLMLEPYSLKKDLLYIAIVPNQRTYSAAKVFLKELSVIYESCMLGRHIAVNRKEMKDPGIFLIQGEKEQHIKSIEDLLSGLKSCLHKSIIPLLKDEKLCNVQSLVDFLTDSDSTAISVGTSSTVNPNVGMSPTGIMLYVVLEADLNAEIIFKTMETMANLIENEDIPYFIRKLLTPQIFLTHNIPGFYDMTFSGSQLRNLAFGTYSCCRIHPRAYCDAQSMTSFGPACDRQKLLKDASNGSFFAPLFALAPDRPSATQSNLMFSGANWLSNDEEVLFCSYCVSLDKKWLLAAFCDKQGQLLSTAVFEIHEAHKLYGVRSCRSMSLQKLWDYCLSVISGTVLSWNVVITRIGIPTVSETAEWLDVIQNDWLITANKTLKGQCTACKETSKFPELISVVISSVQLDNTVHILPKHDVPTSLSHLLILPPHPTSLPTMSPHGGEDYFQEIFTAGPSEMPDDIEFTDDLWGDWGSGSVEQPAAALPQGVGTLDQPLAEGYLISSDSLESNIKGLFGKRVSTFSSDPAVLKVSLHWQFAGNLKQESQNNPLETLGSLLLCFDALAWLNMNLSTRKRKSCLPLHIRVLLNLLEVMDHLK